jgi:predicted secreted protein
MTTKRFIALLVVVVLAAGLFVVAATLPWDSSSDGNGAASDSNGSIPVYTAGDSISVRDGARFVIALEANPSTGYAWTAAENDHVEQVSSKQVQGGSMPGAGGTQRITFEATATGSTTLELDYARSFEPDQPPAETERFSITVR